jgi:hypothetical protein
VDFERSKIINSDNKDPAQICSRVMDFGNCDVFKCSKRHVLINELDQPQHLPSLGKIKFSLLAIKTPINFVIKISEISILKDEWISWEKRNEEIEQCLANIQTFYKDSNTNIIAANAKVGAIFGYFHHMWYRVRLLSKG